MAMTITQKLSPNKDSNRVKIDRIVLHWIVGNLASADAVFSRPAGTSAHYGIEDNEVHQYVPESMVAYHAGNYAMNQRSIGIEHSADPSRPASEQTYKTSGELIRAICLRHGIPIDRSHIIKHQEVVATQCPGTIDIDKIIRYAQGESHTSTNTSTKASFFDLYWHALYGDAIDTDKATKEQVEARIREAKSEKQRGGKWDALANKAGYSGSTDELQVNQLYEKIVTMGNVNLIEQLAQEKVKCQSKMNEIKLKIKNYIDSV